MIEGAERKSALAVPLACAIAASAGLGDCGADGVDGAATAQASDGIDAADGAIEVVALSSKS